jgi:hypothetical protein
MGYMKNKQNNLKYIIYLKTKRHINMLIIIKNEKLRLDQLGPDCFLAGTTRKDYKLNTTKSSQKALTL